jgi:competence protein ComEC
MFNRKLKYGIILSLLALSFVMAGILFYSQKNQDLRVIFLDVGQGDAILVSQGDYQMLIDGGRNGKILLEKLGKYVPFWDREIEIILATHPDQDHIAGLIDVLRNYKVGAVAKTEDPSESVTYQKFKEEIEKEKAQIVEAKKGTEIKFRNKALAKVMYPFFETGDIKDNDSNSGSVVVKIEFGENSFLLTGDLPKNQEWELIGSDANLNSGVLKISHHGSKYSTGRDFLEKVNPEEAVISVGKDNSYGHPSEEVLNILNEKNITVLRTDELGDVIFECCEDFQCRRK